MQQRFWAAKRTKLAVDSSYFWIRGLAVKCFKNNAYDYTPHFKQNILINIAKIWKCLSITQNEKYVGCIQYHWN